MPIVAFGDGTPDVVNSLAASNQPLLEIVARRVCSATRTSADIERVFSSLKLVVGDLRTGLSSEMVDTILFLKHNLKFFPLTADEIWAVYDSL